MCQEISILKKYTHINLIGKVINVEHYCTYVYTLCKIAKEFGKWINDGIVCLPDSY